MGLFDDVDEKMKNKAALTMGATSLPSQEDSKKPEDKPRHQDTVVPRHQDTVTDSSIGADTEQYVERVRRTVRQLGKETATLRLTDLEKGALADIVYGYKKQGIRTTETEIIRVGLNYILDDYEQHGQTSILAGMLERLNQ